MRRKGLLSLSLLLSFALGSQTALWAEKRTYEINREVNKALVDFLDELAIAGIKFKVEDVYTVDHGGRNGLQLRLLPHHTICEAFFLQDPRKKERSVVQIFTQNVFDAERLHKVLVQKLGMKEVGVRSPPKQETEGWPTDPDDKLFPLKPKQGR